ncbi:MAG: 3-deoxy-manno-octulosonate cytidylyltransferase [Bacteroidales bacterium]|nr:3-deoxy-manno-octulosonate cytidylyltransferase [Bacteroidales bacterium]MCF8390100.1 3-deoxy-manno-octulosonate cytidylyltransferase [Bacteroidales bacterium]
MDFIGIIPARYQSTRFPGKPLVLIKDKPMIQWVYEAAQRVLDEVYVATDDERIFDAVKKFNGNVVMTGTEHRSGTDRCREAMESIEKGPGIGFDVVVNIQGDEPFIESKQIEVLMSCFVDESTEIATLVKAIDNENDIFDINKPKVVFDNTNRALMFSRSPIPYVMKRKKEEWLLSHRFYRHIGIYAYRREVLQKITALQPGKLENAESLEQLRWLENGFNIRVMETEYDSLGIDTPEDLQKALKMGFPK